MTEQEEFIGLCDCEEIQKLKKSWDNVWACVECKRLTGGGMCISDEVDEDGDHKDANHRQIVLPTIDQIIEALGDRFRKLQRESFHSDTVGDWIEYWCLTKETTFKAQSPRIALIKALKEVLKGAD